MADAWLVFAQFTEVAVIAAVAAWLFFVGNKDKPALAFSIFLLLEAAIAFGNKMAGHFSHDSWEAWIHLSYFAIYPAFAYFALNFSPRPIRSRYLILSLVVGFSAVATLLYAIDPCLARCTEAGGTTRYGWLELAPAAFTLLPLGFGIILVRDSVAQNPRMPRAASALVGAVLLLRVVLDGSIPFGVWAAGGWATASRDISPDSILASVYGIRIVALALASAVVLGMVWLASRDHAPKPFGLLLAFWPLAFGSGMLLGMSVKPQYADLATPASYVYMLWRTVFPILIAYALVRHGLFNLKKATSPVVYRSPIAFASAIALLVLARLSELYFDGSIFGTNSVLTVVSLGLGVLIPSAYFSSRLAAKRAEHSVSLTFGFVCVVIASAAAEFTMNRGMMVLATVPLVSALQFIVGFRQSEEWKRFLASPFPLPHEVEQQQWSREKRLGYYQAHIHLAWASGSITLEGQRILNELAERLGLTPADQKLAEAAVLGRSRGVQTDAQGTEA